MIPSADKWLLMHLKNAIHASTYIGEYLMLTLYIADVERDAGMKNLIQEEAAKVLKGMKVKIKIPKAAARWSIQELPSTQPESKTGKWIEAYRCPFCGWEDHLYEYDVVGMNYCPNCGRGKIL